MTKQPGFRIKSPFDDVLEDIIKGKKKNINRVQKGYFTQIQRLYGIQFLEYGVKRDRKPFSQGVRSTVNIARRKKLANGSKFDLDVVFFESSDPFK